MGVTYWGQHSYEVGLTLGRRVWGHWLDQHASEFPLPLEDEAADQFAESLGLMRRSADVPASAAAFLLLEPSFGADDLRRATELFGGLVSRTIERHLWG